MISDLLKIIDNLPSELFCHLEEGPLKNRLVASYLDEVDAHTDILEFDHKLFTADRNPESSSQIL